MTVLPSRAADDPNGVLAGYVPATLGARFGARVIEGILGAVVAYAGAFVVLRHSSEGALFAYLALVVGYTVISLAILLISGATIGNLVLGQRQVSARTGRVAGAAAFGKYLLEAVVSVLTLGLGQLALLMTVHPPYNRHWADRAAGVLVVDLKRGRDPRRPAPAAAVPSQPAVPPGFSPGITPVHLPSHATSAPHVSPFAQQPPPPASPIIEAVPRSDVWAPPPVRESAPWSPTPPAVVRDMRSVEPFAPPQVRSGEDLAATQRRGSGLPTIRLDNGQGATVDAVILLGRNPSPAAGFEEARLLAVADQARTISKTHLAIGPAGPGIWVQDLHSTNGVKVADATGAARRIRPGERTPVLPGSTVSYGDRSFVVGSA
ncbi:MAG: RDD family protein [Dermatophilaceae bacterium]